MTNPDLGGRRFFQGSGKVNWVRFIPWTMLVLATSVVLAVTMAALFWVGFYLVVLVPILAAVGLMAMVVLAVKKGHCRSRLAGVTLAAFAGIVVYLGYFYVCMVHDIGLDNAGEIGLLPKYIRLRMETDVIRDVGAPTPEHPENEPRGGRRYINWGTFVFELSLLVLVPCGGTIRQAGRPYCEKCEAWMKREATTFKPEIGPGFVEALRAGSVQSLAALFTSPQKPSAPHTLVAVDYCPNLKAGRSMDCPLYISIKQVAMAPKGVTLDVFENSKGKLLVRQALVDPGEISALLVRFPSLEQIAGTTAAQALKYLQVEVKAAPSNVMAEVKPVDPLYAGKVLTTKTKLIGNAFVLLGLVAVFGSIGLGALGGFLAFPDHPPAGGVSEVSKILGVTLIGLAILIFLANLIMLFTVPDYFGTRYIRGVTFREFGRRPSHWVNPVDPAALFVQVIPRANWGKLKLDDASDLGFLRVDPQKREVLFEGDNEQYRIPGEAITSCEIEVFISGQGSHGATTLYRVVLQANHPSGFWEVPIAQRGNIGKYRAKLRLKWAQALQQQIQAIMQPAPSQVARV